MNSVTVYSNKSQYPNALHMGDFIGLWDVVRNKVIGLSTLAVYYHQAKDEELKSSIKTGVFKNTAKHISAIQDFLAAKGYGFPLETNWERKFATDSSFIIPQSVIDDEEITVSLREILRLTLTLEAESLRYATDIKARKILYGILDDDNMLYDFLVNFQKRKKWSDFSPLALPQ